MDMNSKLKYSPSGDGGISTSGDGGISTSGDGGLSPSGDGGLSPSGVGGMIFAAGLGTRFKPWTDQNPKALAVVNGKSLLQRNIEYLQQYGINNVVVNVHHFQDKIINAIEENNGWG